MQVQVIIPQWQSKILISNEIRAKYWEFKDFSKLPKKHLENINPNYFFKKIGKKTFVIDKEGNKLLKNTKSVGKPKYWVLNGQDLYNAVLDWRRRSKMAEYYHNYFSNYIKDQLTPINFDELYSLGFIGVSISCDIYEIKKGQLIDVSNLWLLEKFFEDSLVNCKIIPDDNPNYVLESGKKRYYWVDNPQERKLVFNIKAIK